VALSQSSRQRCQARRAPKSGPERGITRRTRACIAAGMMHARGRT
jgi:hypothetical protein